MYSLRLTLHQTQYLALGRDAPSVPPLLCHTRAWNVLPSDIKLTSSRASFRKKLKTHFF